MPISKEGVVTRSRSSAVAPSKSNSSPITIKSRSQYSNASAVTFDDEVRTKDELIEGEETSNATPLVNRLVESLDQDYEDARGLRVNTDIHVDEGHFGVSPNHSVSNTNILDPYMQDHEHASEPLGAPIVQHPTIV